MKEVGFTKAGQAVDITGDDYFNRISDMFKQSKNGKEEVLSQDKDSDPPSESDQNGEPKPDKQDDQTIGGQLDN